MYNPETESGRGTGAMGFILSAFSALSAVKYRNTKKGTTMNDDDIKKLCGQVRQIAYDIPVYHAHGHLEKVYEPVRKLVSG
jgi:hypothetical protein